MRSYTTLLFLALCVNAALSAPFKSEVEESKKDVVQQNLVPRLTEDKDLFSNAVEEQEENVEESERSKKSPTTVCVEVQPASPYDKPYTVCEPVHGVSNSKYGSAPSGGYSAPAQSSYSAPAQSGYQAPAAHKAAPAYGSSSGQQYSAPSTSYSAPAAAPAYSAPSTSYSAPAQQYSAPSSSYSVPAQQYSAPSGYSAPAHSAPAYGSAPAQQYSAPSTSYAPQAQHYGSAPAYGAAPVQHHAAPTHAYGQAKPAPAYAGSAAYKEADDDVETGVEAKEGMKLDDATEDASESGEEKVGSFLSKKGKKGGYGNNGGYGKGGYGRSAAPAYGSAPAAPMYAAPAYGAAPSFMVANQASGYAQPQYQAPHTQAASYGSPAGPVPATPAYPAPAPAYSAPAPAYSAPQAYAVAAPAYSAPAAPAYSAPVQTYSAPVQSYSPQSYAPQSYAPQPQVTYTTYAAQPPCPTNYLFSCSPRVAPVPCSQSYMPQQVSVAPYSAPQSYAPQQYSAPQSYSAPVPQYSAPAPTYGAQKGSGYREANEDASKIMKEESKHERASNNAEEKPIVQPAATMASEHQITKQEKMKSDTIARMNEIAAENLKTIEPPSPSSSANAPVSAPLPVSAPIPVPPPMPQAKSAEPAGLINLEDGQAPKADAIMNFVPSYMRTQWTY